MPIEMRKRKKGQVYVVRVQDRASNWFPTKTFQRKVDAEAYERALLVQRDGGGRAASMDTRNLLFKSYYVRWANECRGRASLGWRDSQDRMARKYVLPLLGEMKLQDVSGSDINRVLNLAQERKLEPATVRLVYVLLHKIFADAVDEHELLTVSPVKKKYRPHVNQKERDFLRPTEAWKLLEVAKYDPIGPAVWIATLAGLRAGEIQALKVRAIDFENCQILIRGTFVRRSMVLQDHTKQGDWGKAPLAPPLRAYLLEVVSDKKPDDFVVNGDRDEMMSHNAFLRNLKRLCAKAGVPIVTPHELRHSCTELYVEQGASQEDLRRLLNHSSLNATQRYIHRTDGRLNSIAAAIRAPPTARPTLKLLTR